ncbi:MAG: 2-oxoacid:acceptor oxidoreductase family protein [Desulfobacterales bacterium]|nr:2-oxoacid:acceptor oxidoreductase family protein [Desulfobacterales bacterium]MDD4071369.1 2-oxoacid:acceptor oxidoreductase family protein [Desulfobacterales bacterium]MDD4392659.1 2-oxoacid:acceptor oxidoreductase family protein [Desulfobacterales bacterium]
MQEIRFHGRGGQGTVLASITLAKAFFKSGYYVQTFPVFGMERRGAPVEAYLRLNKKKILLRCNVYTPDHVVIQDFKLLQTLDVTKGLKPGGWILLNAPGLPDNLKPFEGFRLAFIDANQIAMKHKLGPRTQPIINTTMMGAFARTFEMPSMEVLSEAILNEIPAKAHENVEAARDGYNQVTLYGMVTGKNAAL